MRQTDQKLMGLERQRARLCAPKHKRGVMVDQCPHIRILSQCPRKRTRRDAFGHAWCDIIGRSKNGEIAGDMAASSIFTRLKLRWDAARLPLFVISCDHK
jgi:hypothetical protein